MAKKSGLQPRQTAPNSGQNQQIGPRGDKGSEGDLDQRRAVATDDDAGFHRHVG
jgi:hypothetical protein